MQIVKELIEHDGSLYLIIRKLQISYLSNKDGSINANAFNACKEYLGSEKVLKNGEYFLFCEKIQEPEYEDITQTGAKQ